MLSNVNCKLFLDAKENNSKKGKLMMKDGKRRRIRKRQPILVSTAAPPQGIGNQKASMSKGKQICKVLCHLNGLHNTVKKCSSLYNCQL